MLTVPETTWPFVGEVITTAEVWPSANPAASNREKHTTRERMAVRTDPVPREPGSGILRKKIIWGAFNRREESSLLATLLGLSAPDRERLRVQVT
jgi:hypothetical protein